MSTRPNCLPMVGASRQTPCRERRTTRQPYQPQTTQSTDAALPSDHRSTKSEVLSSDTHMKQTRRGTSLTQTAQDVGSAYRSAQRSFQRTRDHAVGCEDDYGRSRLCLRATRHRLGRPTSVGSNSLVATRGPPLPEFTVITSTSKMPVTQAFVLMATEGAQRSEVFGCLILSQLRPLPMLAFHRKPRAAKHAPQLCHAVEKRE